MRCLFIAPSFPDTFWSFRHALKFIRKRAPFPPLGLLTVAAMLPKEWEVRLVDTNVDKLKDADIEWAETAWIGGMTVQSDSAMEILTRCRHAGLRTIVGGPMATCEPERFDEADHLVLNEAEITLPRFLEDLSLGCARHVYESVERPDMRLTPAPRWDLIRFKHYGSMCLQFSRGCPFDCDFCNVTALLGKRPRTKATEQTVGELDALYQAGWRGPVFFVDDNLIGNKKAARELLPALAQWRKGKKQLSLSTEASINLADDPHMQQQMVAAGFDTVFVGIETPDDQALTECQKRQNVQRDLVGDVRKLHQSGLQVQGGFILGFDSDTPSIFQRQLEFVQKSGVVTAMVGLLQAPIGTRLYQRMMNEGRLLGSFTGDNVDGSTNILTRMPLELLQAGYRRVMQNLYSPAPYYQRIKTFLRDYDPPRVKTRFAFSLVPAFMRSVWRLGIFDRGRYEYWKLLAWTLLRRPRHFSLAVRLWIYGHHFRQVCFQRLPTS